jgi:hypothetical protein
MTLNSSHRHHVSIFHCPKNIVINVRFFSKATLGMKLQIPYTVNTTVYWDVMLCSLGDGYGRFGRTFCPHIILISETLVIFYQATGRHIPKDSILNIHRHENFRSLTIKMSSPQKFAYSRYRCYWWQGLKCTTINRYSTEYFHMEFYGFRGLVLGYNALPISLTYIQCLASALKLLKTASFHFLCSLSFTVILVLLIRRFQLTQITNSINNK